MNTKAQGDIGVAMAIAYYTSKGYAVSIPLGDNTRYDIIVDNGVSLVKVQCKCTRYKTSHGTYQIALRTNGGNKSSQTTKLMSETDANIVFGYVIGGNMYEFPPLMFVGKSTITLSKDKDIYIVNMGL